MKAVGFRCYKDALAHVAIDEVVSGIELYEERLTPMPDVDRPSQLVWLRKEVTEILTRIQPNVVAYKAAEPNAPSKDLARAESEGVLQEACESAGLPPLRRVKRQLKADLQFAGSAGNVADALVGTPLAAVKSSIQEAALVALAALAD